MNKWDVKTAFKKYQVGDCKTHDEFMNKYYKHDRYKGKGEEVVKHILEHHRSDFLKDGLDWISKHDSTIGQIVSFYTNTCEYEFDGIPYWLAKETE